MLRFAILSAGNIARRMARTLDGLRDELIPYAVGASDPARAEAMMHEYHFETCYGSYDALLRDPQIDAVYIGLIHPLHAQWVERALAAGKHVLCEKPLTLSADCAERLFALARRQNRVLAEAMWTRTLPFADALHSTLNTPALGKIRSMHFALGANMQDIPRIARPELGGGVLMDIGVYALTLADLAVQSAPHTVSGSCIKGCGGTDLADSICLTYPGGIQATILVEGRCAVPDCAQIFCENGTVALHGPIWSPESITLQLGETVREVPFADVAALPGAGFEYEVRAFAKAVQQGENECPALCSADSLRVLRTADSLLRTWNIPYPPESCALT